MGSIAMTLAIAGVSIKLEDGNEFKGIINDGNYDITTNFDIKELMSKVTFIKDMRLVTARIIEKNMNCNVINGVTFKYKCREVII